MGSPKPSDKLIAALKESERLGFIGKGSLPEQIGHSIRYVEAVKGSASCVEGGHWADLGPGGGIPGLVLLELLPGLKLNLIEASNKRATHLRWCLTELGLNGRAQVHGCRAEELGHGSLREAHDGAVARLFGPPSVTVECAAGLVKVGGMVIVSEPPGGRCWDGNGLASLGLEQTAGADGFAYFMKTAPLIAEFPRSEPAISKRPSVKVE